MYIKHDSSTDPINGKTTRSSSLRFPRFHQWEAVTELTATVTAEGVGHRYLIQHCAGSGKTDSIAWTAHRMARLQVDNNKVFDSVIVVTDRNVLDAQLQDAIKQIDNDAGIVVAIDRAEAAKSGEAKSKSGLLAKALVDGKLIIVVTIQTFPFAMAEIRKNKGLKGKNFAVIADEAHSSQSGEVAAKLKSVLTAEEIKEIEEGGEIDVEAVLAAEATERAESANISYFAFTATPKAKTLELFGRRPAPGEPPAPFHIYTMKQAIQEGYILDVLPATTLSSWRSRSPRTPLAAAKWISPRPPKRSCAGSSSTRKPSRRKPRSSSSTSGRTSPIYSTGTPRRWSSPTPARRRCATSWRSTTTSPRRATATALWWRSPAR